MIDHVPVARDEDKTCPCGNALVREGVTVKAHWTGSICEDCEAGILAKRHPLRDTSGEVVEFGDPVMRARFKAALDSSDHTTALTMYDALLERFMDAIVARLASRSGAPLGSDQ